MIPCCPTRDSPSTSATRRAASRSRSVSSCARTASAPLDAMISTIAPSSKVIARSWTIEFRPAKSGRVERTVPSVRRASGVVKTSSVGRFGTCGIPPPCRGRRRPSVTPAAARPSDRCRASETERVEAERVRAAPYAQPRGVLAPGADRIVLVEANGAVTASHSGSRSGSPNTCSAHPAVGNAAIVQLMRRLFWISSIVSFIATGWARPTRFWSRSASNSGSASPEIMTIAFPSSAAARSRASPASRSAPRRARARSSRGERADPRSGRRRTPRPRVRGARDRPRELEIQNNRGTNWTIAAFPTPGWAEQVFGDPDVDRLWDAVTSAVRLDDDPVAAWRERARLRARCTALDALALDALRFRGPGTDLTVGLLPGSRWHGGGLDTASGIPTSRTCRRKRSSRRPTLAAPRERCARRARSRSGEPSSTTSR